MRCAAGTGASASASNGGLGHRLFAVCVQGFCSLPFCDVLRVACVCMNTAIADPVDALQVW